MIAASEPQEFVPFGRQQIKKHPGNVIYHIHAVHLPYDSFLAQRFSQVVLDDDPDEDKDWWAMRLKDGVEEELYVNGQTVILSRGTMGRSAGFGRINKTSSRVLDVCYTMETKVQQALWANFTHIKDKENVPLPSLCIVDESKITVYTEEGQDYTTPLQFKVSSAWETKYGLLLERVHSNPQEDMPLMDLTTLFSLLHPLDEIAPLLTVKQGGCLSYMNDPNLKVVFTSAEPSLCVIYNAITDEHTIWKLRQTMNEECIWMVGQDSGLILNNTSVTSTANFSGSNISSGSAQFSFRTATNRSSGNTSPLLTRSSGGSLHNSILSLNQQKHCHSLWRSEGSNASSVDARLGCSTTPAIEAEPKPIIPELCLEFMWTDAVSPSQRKEGDLDGPARKAFITQDILDQQYLGYLTNYQLVLVKIGTTNTDEIIIGTVTKISAYDAASFEKLKMLAVFDTATRAIMLYTGPVPVGKLHVGGVSAELVSSYYLTHYKDVPLNSPFPKRDSMLSSTKVGDGLFNETSLLISPVYSESYSDKLNLMRVLTDNSSPPLLDRVQGIRDALGSRFTLEFSNGSMFRFSLPEYASSPLVKQCIEILKSVLQRDCAIHALVKWYTIRNAPGAQDMSPKHEWHLFVTAILGLLGYQLHGLQFAEYSMNSDFEDYDTPIKLTKRMRASELGSNEDWKYLLKSTYHGVVNEELVQILRLDPIPVPSSSFENDVDFKPISSASFNTSAPLFPHIHLVLFSLHLLYEELKLWSGMSSSRGFLGRLLYMISVDLNLIHYAHYYWKDNPTLCPLLTNEDMQDPRIPVEELEKMSVPQFFNDGEPPCLFEHAYRLRQNMKYEPYPVMAGVNPKSRNVLEVLSVICGTTKPCLKTVVPPGSRCPTPTPVPLEVPEDLPNTHRAVLLMIKLGMKQEDVYSLPCGLSLILTRAIQDTSENPSPGWDCDVYKFIGRLDLCHTPNQSTNLIEKSNSTPFEEKLSDKVLNLRFSRDLRVAEVRKLLDSSEPVTISIAQRPEVSDHEFIEEQERHLYAICTRTMALPVGRGMLNLHTAKPLTSEPLDIPRLCLSGKAPPRGTTVELSHIEIVPNMNLWPLFHNGVAAGLEICPSSRSVDATWIIYNKPKNNTDALPEHAGFLMALGLSGHLDNLSELNLYNYLNKCHEMTSVGLLLGLASSKRGTMDFRATKLFSVHIESLLPPTSIELDLIQNIQVAALLGIGLVYQGTAHRHITEVLLAEIGRPPGPEMENSCDREGYSLAAGLGLGLVILGTGTDPSGLSDPTITDTLHYYIVGGTKRPLTGSQKEKYKSPSYQIKEGDTVNNHVTGPGATLALGMMYFDSCNKSISMWLDPPNSEYLLDFVCPDMLLLRALARGLIQWSKIIPTKAYIEAHVPPRIRPYCLVKPREGMENVDLETMNQAYCNIIAGACMAMGLRFAGSANNEAYETLIYYVRLFVTISTKSLAELPGKSTVETCICVCLLSLSLVMAGTGDLGVLRLCRHLGARTGNPAVTYGSHLAVHMSLGLLFLGGGLATLSTRPEAVAAMICAFFPRFPTHSNDNRYHLQAFRHLYVLAVERRILLPRDIDTGNLCYAHLTVVYLDTPYYKNQSARLLAPAILPELFTLQEVRVEDDRYWPIVFHRDKNWNELEKLLKCDVGVGVKQRAGCLPYSEDRHGFRTLLAQTLSTAEESSWAVSTESILAFTSNKHMVQLVKYFLESNHERSSTNEEELIQWLSSAAYEFTSQDRLALLNPWIVILSDMMKVGSSSDSHLLWQMKLVYAESLSVSSKYSSLGLAQAHYIHSVLETWFRDNKRLVQDYVVCKPVTGTQEQLNALAGYLTYYGFPLQSQLGEIFSNGGRPKSILDVHMKLRDYCVTSPAVKIIWQFYQKQEND